MSQKFRTRFPPLVERFHDFLFKCRKSNTFATPGRAGRGQALDEWYYIWYNKSMTTITTSQARAQLFNLVDAAIISHRPVQIKGRRASAVLVSSEDWEAIQETLYLLSVPGMRESLVKNMKTPVAKCAKKLPW